MPPKIEKSTDGAGTETTKVSIPVIDLPSGGEMCAEIYRISGGDAGTGMDFEGAGAGVGFSWRI